MKWNYRMVQCVSTQEEDIYYTFFEVYYDENGAIQMYNNSSSIISNDSVELLLDDIDKLIDASKRPTLHYEDGQLIEMGKVC